jgi:hypothetical protein
MRKFAMSCAKWRKMSMFADAHRYSSCVLVLAQVQGVCDNRGNIIWYSGPHLGVTSDIKLFRENPPPLLDGERLLGDKAYVGLRGRVLVPYKKKKGAAGLTTRRHEFNMVHGWYRATIEHCFAFVKRSVPRSHVCVKYRILSMTIDEMRFFVDLRIFAMFALICAIIRFRILNGVYRGRIVSDAKYLTRALKIIMHTNYIYTRDHQQRFNLPMELDLDELDAAAAPMDVDRGTGFEFDDFHIGDKVEVWYMRSWWHGRVTYLARATQTLSVRLTGSRDPMAGILPKHAKPSIDA